MQVPTLKKIVINLSTTEAVKNPKVLNNAVEELAAISGQKAVITKAKKSISNFKLREGMPIGCMVTLRKESMWSFLGAPDSLVASARARLPRPFAAGF